jgi:hypothetical protein
MRNIVLVFVVAACGPRLPGAATPAQYVCEVASSPGEAAIRTCRTRDRAHQALALFNDGTSLGSIAARLGLASGAEARELVHAALIEIERRYYR